MTQNPLYKKPSQIKPMVLGAAIGITATIFAYCSLWSVRHWKAISVTVQNPDAVAQIAQVSVVYEIKK